MYRVTVLSAVCCAIVALGQPDCSQLWTENGLRNYVIPCEGLICTQVGTSSIPTSIGSLTLAEGCTDQVLVQVSNVGLTGTIPTELGAIANPLVLFDASQNELSGEIPKEVYLANWTGLNFESNLLTNNVSATLFAFDSTTAAPEIKIMRLFNNPLVGSYESPEIQTFALNPLLEEFSLSLSDDDSTCFNKEFVDSLRAAQNAPVLQINMPPNAFCGTTSSPIAPSTRNPTGSPTTPSPTISSKQPTISIPPTTKNPTDSPTTSPSMSPTNSPRSPPSVRTLPPNAGERFFDRTSIVFTLIAVLAVQNVFSI